MPVQLKFILTLDDYLAAQRLHARSNWWLRLNLFVGRIILPIMGVLIIALACLISGKAMSWAPVSGMVAMGLWLTLYPFYMRSKFKRCYARTRTDKGECTLELDENRISLQGSNAKTEVNWSAIKSSSESDQAILLYLAPAKFFVVPKRACDEQQLNEIRDLCKRKLSRQQEVAA